MALFNFGKQKEKKTPACACGCHCSACAEEEAATDRRAEAENRICRIKVLGAGCRSCREQYENVKKAVEDMGLSAKAEYIADIHKVAEYGVMSMPAIVVNEKVVSAGKVLRSAEVVALLQKKGILDGEMSFCGRFCNVY